MRRYVGAAALCLAVAVAASAAGAAEAGPSADLTEGIRAYNAGRVDDARRLLSAAADRGGAEAMVNLGYLGLATAFAPDLPAAEREAGVASLRSAARRGNVAAQGALRNAGDTEAFPPGIDTSLPMVPEPRPPVPGTTRVCGNLTS